MAELIDRAAAERHRAESWSQRVWEENARTIGEHAVDLVVRELVSRLCNGTFLETLGLIEVGYPGIETIPAPAALLGGLPSAAAGDRLRTVWTDFLCAL